MPPLDAPPSRLWIGGSSSLTRSYLNAFPGEKWILTGAEKSSADWMAEPMADNCQYVACDFSQSEEILDKVLHSIPAELDCVVLGIRPPLVTHRTDAHSTLYCQSILDGLRHFLTSIIQRGRVRKFIHVSSIAVVGHLDGQQNQSERDPEPKEVLQPYDRFKHESEKLVASLCSGSISFTNIRLGAIFSDDPSCIQCCALGLQAYVGPYLPVPIDCNSGRNAATLIHAVLGKQERKLRPVYYYTRPTQYQQPVPYGEYLKDFRQGNGIPFYCPLPIAVVHGFVALIHLLSVLIGSIIPYLQSVDYLLQVSRREHSFDLSAVKEDFSFDEETIEECFRRRAKYLRSRRYGKGKHHTE